MLAAVAQRPDLALGAADAEADRHQDAVHLEELPRPGRALDLLGVDVDDLDRALVGDGAVEQGLVQALVGVRELDVLAHQADPDRHLRVADLADQLLPRAHVAPVVGEVEQVEQALVQPFAAERQRHLVDGVHVPGLDDALGLQVAEQGDLLAQVRRQGAVAAAQQDVGRDADRAQLTDRVLGRLGLELVGGGDVGHQGEVDVDRVVLAHLLAELPDRLQEGQRLDVAHRAADLHDHHVDGAVDLAHRLHDLVGDVGDHLHRLAQVVAAALLGDHLLVDLAGGEVVALRGGGVGEALVVPQVQVGLGAVVGDEDLAVLVGGHRSRVDVDVRVEFHQRDREAPGFEDGAHRSGGHALAQRRNDPARHENVLGCHAHLLWLRTSSKIAS